MKNTGTLCVALSGNNEIVMTRVFDAPRALLYEAFMKPELLKRWSGPGDSRSTCAKWITASAEAPALFCANPTAA